MMASYRGRTRRRPYVVVPNECGPLAQAIVWQADRFSGRALRGVLADYSTK